MIRDRAIFPRTVSALALSPGSTLNTSARGILIDDVGKNLVCGVYSSSYLAHVIVRNMLFCGARYSVVVLGNANNIHHGRFSLQHGINLSVGGRLIQCFDGKKIVGALKGVGSISHVLLGVGS